MITKSGIRIEIISETKVSPEIFAGVMTSLQKKLPFVLITEDNEEAIAYFPAKLMAKHSNGQTFSYDCEENFIDAVRMTIPVYPKFMTAAKFIEPAEELLLPVKRALPVNK